MKHEDFTNMSYPKIRFLIAISACLFFFTTASMAVSWSKGDRLPDLEAFALEGAVPKLEGKVVLVDFWASWCTPCKASFPVLDEIEATYRDRGLVILGINVDRDSKAFEKFMKRMKPGFFVVRDPNQKLVADAGVETMPSSFLIGRDGVIRSVHSGYHGNKTREQYIEEIESLLAEPEGGKG
jgi:thiol-disulfide isomerase/thioredoxin